MMYTYVTIEYYLIIYYRMCDPIINLDTPALKVRYSKCFISDFIRKRGIGKLENVIISFINI